MYHNPTTTNVTIASSTKPPAIAEMISPAFICPFSFFLLDYGSHFFWGDPRRPPGPSLAPRRLDSTRIAWLVLPIGRIAGTPRDHKYALLPCRASRPKPDVSGNPGLFSSCMLDAPKNISASCFTERVSQFSFLLKSRGPMEHARHIGYAARIPVADVLIESRGHKKHRFHTRHLARVPPKGAVKTHCSGETCCSCW